MRLLARLAVVVAVAGVGPGCDHAAAPAGPVSSPTLLVAAAVSVGEAIGLVADAFETQTGTRVLLNVAGSQILATQILEGAPVDIFVSADMRQMTRVVDGGRIDAARQVALLSNQLVVVVPSGPAAVVRRPEDLTGPAIRRIALGDPDAVPAGVYAREYLDRVGVWPAVAAKVVPTRSVRAALRAVESGAADAGIVYRTDLATSTGAGPGFVVPLADGPRVVYPAGVSVAPVNPGAAARFFEFLRSAEAGRLFEASGFVSLVAS